MVKKIVIFLLIGLIVPSVSLAEKAKVHSKSSKTNEIQMTGIIAPISIVTPVFTFDTEQTSLSEDNVILPFKASLTDSRKDLQTIVVSENGETIVYFLAV